MSLSLNLKTYLSEGHPFRTQGNFSEKQYFLPPMRTRYANVIANAIAFRKFCIRAKYRSSKTEISNCKWPIPRIKRIRFYVFCDKWIFTNSVEKRRYLICWKFIFKVNNKETKMLINWYYSRVLFWLVLNKLNIIFCTFTKYFYCWFWICICAIKVRK